MHHLRQDEEMTQAVGDLLGDELHKVGDQLMKARVVSEARQGRRADLLVRLVQDPATHSLKVEL